jgi:hypothetical protein
MNRWKFKKIYSLGLIKTIKTTGRNRVEKLGGQTEEERQSGRGKRDIGLETGTRKRRVRWVNKERDTEQERTEGKSQR